MFDWDAHYKEGGQSGENIFYERTRVWKHGIVFRYFNPAKESIVDLGCGDLRVWGGVLPQDYTGIDISREIIRKNQQAHPDANFIVSDITKPLQLKADVVTSFAVLVHIMCDEDYTSILKNIKSYATKCIIIETWNQNPFASSLSRKLLISAVRFKKTGVLSLKTITSDGEYQCYRDFVQCALPIFSPEFKLENVAIHPDYPLLSLYIWKRCIT
jgi:SAM-dependent methyltransferase